MSRPPDARPRLRVASVAYVNARPLVEGLDATCDLAFDVPSALVAYLADGRADVALLPVIDLQRLPGLRVVASGGIGCDGPTLTVRIFSPVPLADVSRLAVDPDSHTSVALARVTFRRRFGRVPEFVPLADARDGDARLLIGDKVVTAEPDARLFPLQLDLGGAWKDDTGLPFVFAVWAARADVELGDLPRLLADARVRGMNNIDAIVRDHAVPRGWPTDVAWRYYTEYLRFDVGSRQLEAIRRFHAEAYHANALEHPPHALEVVTP